MSKRLRDMRISRARARAEKPTADPPAVPLTPAAAGHDPAEKFAEKAHDLDAFRKSIEDAASVSGTLWLSYLFVLFYIAIAAGGVTQKDLLLESPVKLPFLSDVPLPLVAFFFLAPIIFIVSHTYTLMHFVMLAAKVGVYDTELRVQLGETPETRDAFRRQLPSNIFVQFLAGPSDIRNGLLGLLLKAIAWVSLVIGPVLLLLLIQVQFLPYHLEWLTWVHRLAILVDVTLLWALWPAVLNGRSKVIWRLERRGAGWRSTLALTGRYLVGLTASLVPVGLAFTAATFPGERLDDWIGERQWIPPNRLMAWLGHEDKSDKPKWTSFHNILFNSRFYEGYSHNESLFPTTLELGGFDTLKATNIDDIKLDSIKHTLILNGRHLEYADFNFADLRKVDFGGAYLQDATFVGARLQRADFTDAKLQGAGFEIAQLQGASLDHAELQGASLFTANFKGATLEYAQLQGAALYFTWLDGASLVGARLQGATLIGASLATAQLQGASLEHAQLQGASLGLTRLQGAALNEAELHGANLFGAQLQGAFLERAKLAGALLFGTFVWRARFDPEPIEVLHHQPINWDSDYMDFQPDLIVPQRKPWTKASYLALRKVIEEEVPAGPRVHVEVGPSLVFYGDKEHYGAVAGRDAALKRIESLDPNKPFELESEVPKWKKENLEAKRSAPEEYEKTLAGELKLLACSGDADAAYVVRGLIGTAHDRLGADQITSTHAQAPDLVDAILKPDCPVSAALTDADKAALKKLAKEASAPPKPDAASDKPVRHKVPHQ
jgi:uncharacterized protein YjbI with pentapeptide repeats